MTKNVSDDTNEGCKVEVTEIVSSDKSCQLCKHKIIDSLKMIAAGKRKLEELVKT